VILKREFLLAASTTVLALASPGLALAQTAQPDSPATAAPTAPDSQPAAADIIVTGQRAALASAQNIKRLAPQVVDSIVAQDIGKFPDNAVSDSLQRITACRCSAIPAKPTAS
jgi:hypothetical protein